MPPQVAVLALARVRDMNLCGAIKLDKEQRAADICEALTVRCLQDIRFVWPCSEPSGLASG
jgi:hypothetical protein